MQKGVDQSRVRLRRSRVRETEKSRVLCNYEEGAVVSMIMDVKAFDVLCEALEREGWKWWRCGRGMSIGAICQI